MRFMLLQYYAEPDSGAPVMTEWTPDEVRAHIEFQHVLNAELIERGEFVDAQGLSGPDQAAVVTVDERGARVVTDGPYPETKELIAGYRMIDVASRERALEIAAKAAAAPGPGGAPLRDRIEVREVLGAPGPEAESDAGLQDWLQDNL
jgi:hypothetical protein